MNKPPTIHDLAADLKISSTTVWRALNDQGRISTATRDKILRRAKDLDYVPSLIAQNLSQGRTHTVGIIVPTIAHPVFSALIEKLEAAAFERGYNIVLGSTHLELNREAELARMLFRRRVEGVIVIPFSQDDPGEWDAHLLHLQKQRIPVVLLEQGLPGGEFSRVVADNEGAAYEMTRHLIGLGHEHIAFAFHPFHERDFVGHERLAGFRKAMADHGLGRKARLLLDACEFGARQQLLYRPECVVACLREKDRPTAIFAGMDLLAIHILDTIRREGLQVPRDVALAGFDNIEFSKFTEPPLTTVQQPIDDMALEAARLLFDLIEKKKAKRAEILCQRLPCQLVIRESCGSSASSKKP